MHTAMGLRRSPHKLVATPLPMLYKAPIFMAARPGASGC